MALLVFPTATKPPAEPSAPSLVLLMPAPLTAAHSAAQHSRKDPSFFRGPDRARRGFPQDDLGDL